MQTINLDIISGGVNPVAHVSQCDTSLPIRFDLYDGGEVYTIPSGAIVTICGTKADGNMFAYSSASDPDIIAYSDSSVTFYTTIQSTAAAGNAICELKINDGDAKIYSENWIMDVENSAMPEDGQISESDIPMIVKAVEAGEQIAELDDKLKEASEIVSTVEKSSADAKDSAAKAEQSATDAATSEANAKAAETASAASATAASASANAAATSQSEAKKSQTNAASSATKAANQATAAASSATNAATSETNAKASETAAATSEANAKSSATNAATSEKNAVASETNASTSATAAATSAANAKTSESNASASATKASTSETNAKASATAANNSAANAKTSESNASASAILAESWAVGGTGTRTGEDADNSKYYAQQAAKSAQEAAGAVTGVATWNGRAGAVIPQSGDYTADMVGAMPVDRAATASVLGGVKVGSNITVSSGTISVTKSNVTGALGYTPPTTNTTYSNATTSAAGLMSASDKSKLDGIDTGATKVTVDDALSATSANPVANKAVQSALDTINSNISSQGTRLSSAESNISKLDSGKADKATTLAGYGITDGATKTELATKADQSGLDVTYAMAKNLSDNFGLLSTTPMFFGCNGDKSLDSFETGIQLLNGSILGISDWFLIIGTGTMGTGMQVAFGLSSNSLIKRYASGGSINGWVRLI